MFAIVEYNLHNNKKIMAQFRDMSVKAGVQLKIVGITKCRANTQKLTQIYQNVCRFDNV